MPFLKKKGEIALILIYSGKVQLIALLERNGFRCFYSRHNPLYNINAHLVWFDPLVLAFDMSFVNTNLVAT